MAARKKRLSWKQIQLHVLLNGVNGEEGMDKIKDNVSPESLRRVLKDLKERNHILASDLEKYMLDKLRVGIRGRDMPCSGTSRVYKAQQVQDSGVFIRLPVNTLKVKKGDAIKVSFDEEQITAKAL